MIRGGRGGSENIVTHHKSLGRAKRDHFALARELRKTGLGMRRVRRLNRPGSRPPPLFERLKNQGVEQLPELKAHRSGRVSHEHHGELLGRVGPEIWPSRTGPMILAG